MTVLIFSQQHLLNELQKELDRLSNQSRFIKMVIDGDLVIAKRKKKDLVAELRKLNFKPFPKVADARKEGEFEAVAQNDDDADESEDVQAGANDYDYLLGMAIWSLTQERIEKLLRQIGDKEMEIDVLIKLTPKDLWNKDLDDFLIEWHLQLDDERKRAKKYAGMGRRTSQKLGIEGKAGKRKKDDDDDDFEVSKKKAKQKTNALSEYIKSAPAMFKPAPKPISRPATKDAPVVVDMLDGSVDEDEPPKKVSLAVQKSRAPAPAKAPPKKVVKSDPSDDEMDEDVFIAVAKEEAKKSRAPARTARTVAKKPIKYDDSSDESDSDGDDMLGDVSTMVKGLGGSSSENTTTRPLFSATAARPGSSHGLSVKAKERLSSVKPRISDDSDVDMTDYHKLVPQDSPQRPAARTANETILSDDNDSDVVITKPKAKPVARLNKPAAKAVAKPAAKPAAKKAAAPEVKKPAGLSPAAKAYALKQKKAAAAVKDDEDDDEDLVNDLISDDDDEPVVKKPAAPAARLGRRAATTKKSKYVESEDEDSESESEASFDDDEDDSF